MKPLHTIIIVILAIVGALYWYSSQQEQHYDVAAQRFINLALTDTGSWQRDNIKKHLAPQALAVIDDSQIDALIARYRDLGTYKRIDDLQFARLTAALSFFSSNILLSYQGTAVFEHGTATLAITLIARESQLQIYNFNFGTPQITPSAAQRNSAPAQINGSAK